MLYFRIILSFAFLIIFSIFSSDQNRNIINNDFKLGLENISDNLLKRLTIKKNGKAPGVALITNQTGIDQNRKRNIDILVSKRFNLKFILAPEHGIDGKTPAEKIVNDLKDPKTGILIKSLYMGDSKFVKFEADDLKDIDFFIFDIQDSGMRHYTYISILYKIIEICSQFKKPLIVLDRPNPLGYIMEGPLVDQDLISFISIAPIPLRHAMTVGELAKYFNKHVIKEHCKLIVVPMKNYHRTKGLNNSLPIQLSPNIKNMNACKNYSFLGIMGEISPCSALVNTKFAFECLVFVDCPANSKIECNNLKNLLIKNGVNTEYFKFKKEDGSKFVGLKIKIRNINNFSGFKTIIDILRFLQKAGCNLSYSRTFDKVIGTSQFKQFIDNRISKKEFYNKVNSELKNFYEKARDSFIYFPFPKIIELK